MSENQKGFAAFLAKKDIVFSAKRYGIDALGAMAQGLFASLLIGTILKTLGQQLGVAILVDIGTFAQAVTGPAMAVSIGYALKCPPLVLFSLIAVGGAANQLGGAGGGILSSGGFCHQLTGLVVQLAQPPFNIGKTHALSWNRSQLHLHSRGDLPDQRTLLAHDGVDCGEDCLLERFLVQRW